MKKTAIIVILFLVALGIVACKAQITDSKGNCVNYNVPDVTAQPTVATQYTVNAVPCPTTGPTSTTTPVTTTTPIPFPASWPSENSTGAVGTLKDVSGDIVLGDDNLVYQNMRVNGTLTVTACNVTIKNVEVDSGEPFTGNNTPDLFAIWLKHPDTCKVTLDHVSVITAPAPNVYVTTGIRNAYGSPVTITNSKLIGQQLGVLGLGSGLVQGNYVLLGSTMRGDHNDAVQIDGSANLTIDHNTLLNPNGQTSALALFTEFGNNSNDLVKNNLFAGGGYACYCGDGKTDNNGNPARSNNVSFVNNVFWQKYFTTVGAFGPGRAYNPAGGGVWQNNVYMLANGTLTTQQVAQPPLDQ